MSPCIVLLYTVVTCYTVWPETLHYAEKLFVRHFVFEVLPRNG